jgi:phenylalanyl-tRNA synthetase alpha chain
MIEKNLIIENINKDLQTVKNMPDFQIVKAKYLGKKGEIKELMKNMTNLSIEEKKVFGQKVNELKNEVEEILNTKLNEMLEEEKKNAELKQWIDITLPSTKKIVGKEHLISSTMKEICEIFVNLGFTAVEGNEIENSWFNFDALNTPKWHPARDMQDTFYIESEDEKLLRTHTSNVQIRTMMGNEPPIAVVSAGRVYRKDEMDATHLPVFHQVEVLFVDKNVSVAHLKMSLEAFAKQYFGDEVEILLRPSFFPFVEPGFEVDISCIFCGGKGCNVCKNTGWIEILGAGLVHPNVLENVNYNSEKWQGFAFGIGVERVAMLKHNLKDMREFVKNDVRFIEK